MEDVDAVEDETNVESEDVVVVGEFFLLFDVADEGGDACESGGDV